MIANLNKTTDLTPAWYSKLPPFPLPVRTDILLMIGWNCCYSTLLANSHSRNPERGKRQLTTAITEVLGREHAIPSPKQGTANPYQFEPTGNYWFNSGVWQCWKWHLDEKQHRTGRAENFWWTYDIGPDKCVGCDKMFKRGQYVATFYTDEFTACSDECVINHLNRCIMGDNYLKRWFGSVEMSKQWDVAIPMFASAFYQLVDSFPRETGADVQIARDWCGNDGDYLIPGTYIRCNDPGCNFVWPELSTGICTACLSKSVRQVFVPPWFVPPRRHTPKMTRLRKERDNG
jgi:hypothetical protein